jgi:hypothetical protein
MACIHNLMFRRDAHLIVSIYFVNAAFHASSREPCRTTLIRGVIQYSRKSGRRLRWSPRKLWKDPPENGECPLSAVGPEV